MSAVQVSSELLFSPLKVVYSCMQEPKDVDLLNITSMACPALPLCPLAQTEAERGILPILKRIRAVFDKVFICRPVNYQFNTREQACAQSVPVLVSCQLIIEIMFPAKQVGIKDEESVVVRITGCPNGCARPYMAEVGFVGDGPNSYQVQQC